MEQRGEDRRWWDDVGVDSSREDEVCADYRHSLAVARGRRPVVDPQLEPALGELADALCMHAGEDFR